MSRLGRPVRGPSRGHEGDEPGRTSTNVDGAAPQLDGGNGQTVGPKTLPLGCVRYVPVRVNVIDADAARTQLIRVLGQILRDGRRR